MPVRRSITGNRRKPRTPRLPLRQMPRMGQRRVFYFGRPVARNHRQRAHRALSVVRMGATLFLQTLRHTPVCTGRQRLLHQRRVVCRQRGLWNHLANLYRLQSTVLRLGQRYPEADRSRVFRNGGRGRVEPKQLFLYETASIRQYGQNKNGQEIHMRRKINNGFLYSTR